MLRFAANISFLFKELPFLDRFAAAAEAGFGLVECHWPYNHPVEALRDRMERARLSLVMVNTAPGNLEAAICAPAPKARGQGIVLVIEPINARSAPGYFLTTSQQAADLIAEIDRPNLKLLFDVFHLQIMEGDIITRLERLKPIIGHVQIAGVPSRAEPDEGEINYRAVFDALERIGYDEVVGCEYLPRAATKDGLAWRRTLGV